MVTIRICRKTGKEISVDNEQSPLDQPIEKMAEIIAEWAIESGVIEQVIRQKKDATSAVAL